MLKTADDDAACCEAWSRIPPIPGTHPEGLRYETSENLIFGSVTAPESKGPLAQRAQDAYTQVFTLLRQQGFAHTLRFWNYLPRLNEIEAGLERYRSFNLGRHAAFEHAGRLKAESIPAACALGVGDEALRVYFLASRSPGRPVENPRQVNAWRYPEAYGPVSPTFARALAHPANDPQALFVSGTASIVGHETLHVGDVVAQTRETCANLEAVFAEASRLAPFRIQDAHFKAYVRRVDDLPVVRRELMARLGEHARIAYLRADICRADLLVEVEAFCRRGP
jgi:chorismate lyase/3-hydroxybenzoate synthase